MHPTEQQKPASKTPRVWAATPLISLSLNSLSPISHSPPIWPEPRYIQHYCNTGIHPYHAKIRIMGISPACQVQTL